MKISCPECEAPVSNQASACPKCGYDFKGKKEQAIKDKEGEIASLTGVVGGVVVFVLLRAMGMDNLFILLLLALLGSACINGFVRLGYYLNL